LLGRGSSGECDRGCRAVAGDLLTWSTDRGAGFFFVSLGLFLFFLVWAGDVPNNITKSAAGDVLRKGPINFDEILCGGICLPGVGGRVPRTRGAVCFAHLVSKKKRWAGMAGVRPGFALGEAVLEPDEWVVFFYRGEIEHQGIAAGGFGITAP